MEFGMCGWPVELWSTVNRLLTQTKWMCVRKDSRVVICNESDAAKEDRVVDWRLGTLEIYRSTTLEEWCKCNHFLAPFRLSLQKQLMKGRTGKPKKIDSRALEDAFKQLPEKSFDERCFLLQLFRPKPGREHLHSNDPSDYLPKLQNLKELGSVLSQPPFNLSKLQHLFEVTLTKWDAAINRDDESLTRTACDAKVGKENSYPTAASVQHLPPFDQTSKQNKRRKLRKDDGTRQFAASNSPSIVRPQQQIIPAAAHYHHQNNSLFWLEALPPQFFPQAARFMDVASLVALSKTSAILQANVTALDWKCTDGAECGRNPNLLFANLVQDEEPTGCAGCGQLRCADCTQRCDECGSTECRRCRMNFCEGCDQRICFNCEMPFGCDVCFQSYCTMCRSREDFNCDGCRVRTGGML